MLLRLFMYLTLNVCFPLLSRFFPFPFFLNMFSSFFVYPGFIPCFSVGYLYPFFNNIYFSSVTFSLSSIVLLVSFPHSHSLCLSLLPSFLDLHHLLPFLLAQSSICIVRLRSRNFNERCRLSGNKGHIG